MQLEAGLWSKTLAQQLEDEREKAEQRLVAAARRAQSSLADVLSRPARRQLAEAITSETFRSNSAVGRIVESAGTLGSVSAGINEIFEKFRVRQASKMALMGWRYSLVLATSQPGHDH